VFAAGARGRGRCWVGGGRKLRQGAARRERRRQPQPEHGALPHAQRSPAQPPWRGLGVTGSSKHGRSAAEPVPTTWPPGGRMGEARRSVRSSALPSPRGAGSSGLAAQLAAGAAQRRRLTSRCADRSAAGCADWPYRYDQSGASHCPPPPTWPACQRPELRLQSQARQAYAPTVRCSASSAVAGQRRGQRHSGRGRTASPVSGWEERDHGKSV